MVGLTRNVPQMRRALVQDEEGKPEIADIPLPELLPGMAIIKVKAVGLNPVDYKMGSAFPGKGLVVGSDFAGTIVAIADDADTDLRVGDLVFSLTNGSNPAQPTNGAFTTYLRTFVSLLVPIEPTANESDIEHASTLGTALATCTLAFWDSENLNLTGTPDDPDRTKTPILVYGGSTATGRIAIQLLKLSGYQPIATCSPRNFGLVRKCGASAVFDYADSETPAAIKQHTGGRLKHVLDCISDAHSVELCYAAIARVGGRYVSLEAVPDELLARRRAVHPSFLMAYELSGEGTPYPGAYGKAPSPEKHELGMRFFPMFGRLVQQGKLHMYRRKRLRDGFEGILEGLTALHDGSMTGNKLVVFLSDD